MSAGPRKLRPLMPTWRAVLAIAWKDVRAELRGRELVSAMLLFTLITVLVFSLALELDANARRDAAAGVLWVTVAFAGILGLGRSLSAEYDRGSLDALLLAPIARSALFFGKLVGNLLFVLITALLLLVLLSVLFNLALVQPLLVLVVLLGCIGFTTSGTLIASMSVHARAREALLPVLLLPVALPVLIAAVRASGAIINDLPSDDWLPWLELLAAADVLFLAAAVALFDYVVEE